MLVLVKVVEDSADEIGTEDGSDGEDAGDEEVFPAAGVKGEERADDEGKQRPGYGEADGGAGCGFKEAVQSALPERGTVRGFQFRRGN